MKSLFRNPKIMIPAIIAVILTLAVSIFLILNSDRIRVIWALYDALDTELIETCMSGPITADAGFVISSLECGALPDDSYFSGVGLKLSAMADTDRQMLDMKITPTFLIYAAPSVCIRHRDDFIGLSAPELYGKEFVFDTAQPFEGYENSALHEMSGIDLPDDSESVSANLLEPLSDIKKTFSKKELRKKILESDIKKTAAYAAMTTPDGHEYTCECYTVTFSSGEIITVYIDKAGKLRCLKYDCTSLYFCGTKEVTNEFCLVTEQLQLTDDITITLTAYGTTDNYKQNRYSIDKDFTVDADNIEFTLYSGEDELIHINGSAGATILPGGTPICEDLPDEDLYSMNRSEIQNVMSEIYENLQNNQLIELIITYMGETGFDDPMNPETR